MTVTARSRFRLPALLLMLTVAGCALQRSGPEGTAPGGLRLATPEAQPSPYQQFAIQMAVGAHGEAYLVGMKVKQEDEAKDVTFQLSRSEDGGATWSGPRWSRKPEPGMFIEAMRLITGTKGQVYLAWRERNAEKTDTRILMTRSLDGGKHWDATPRQLAVGDHLGPPSPLAGPDGALYVAWLGGDESRRVLEVATSLDSGGTFTRTAIQPVLAESNRGITNPQLAADEKGRVYVAWEEGMKGSRRRSGIYLSRSEDQGRSWSGPILVSHLWADSRGAHAPEIAAASDGQVYLIWEQAVERTVTIEGRRRPFWPVDRLIYFNRSLDGGRTWLSEPVRLSQLDPTSPNRRRSLATRIVCDGRGHIYVVFNEEEGPTSQRLLVSHSADSGVTWAPPTEFMRTSPVKGRLEGAVLVHDGGGRLRLVWQEHALGPRYGWFVLMNRSENYGRKWEKQAIVMGEPTVGQTTARDVLVSVGENGLILTAWDHGARVYQPISLNRSVDGGKSWSMSRLPLE